MDNTTDPNSTNTPPPVPAPGPTAVPPSMPSPAWTPPSDTQPIANPSSAMSSPLPSSQDSTPTWQNAPVTQGEPPPAASPWTPPSPQSEPSSLSTPAPTPQPFDINSLMGSSPQPAPTGPASTPNPGWNPPAPTPSADSPQLESLVTFPPASQPEAVSTTPSPLDNPWGAPSQVPPLDGPAPTFTAEANTTPSTPNWSPSSNLGDSTPTDLSQLIANNNSQPGAPASPQPTGIPETLVVSQANTVSPEVPTVPTEEHKTIPKWLLGLGGGLLLVVIGASAYFILGIGQPPKTTTSVPAITRPTVKTPPPVATPVPQATPPVETQATGSASFGQLGGTGSQTPQATSAADIIRQRQQQGR